MPEDRRSLSPGGEHTQRRLEMTKNPKIISAVPSQEMGTNIFSQDEKSAKRERSRTVSSFYNQIAIDKAAAMVSETKCNCALAYADFLFLFRNLSI